MVNATTTPYDLLNVSGSNNILEFVQAVNNLTGQWFMFGILIVGFIILFVNMLQKNNNRDALLVSGFITAIVGIFFATLDFISFGMLSFVILLFGAIFMFAVFKPVSGA